MTTKSELIEALDAIAGSLDRNRNRFVARALVAQERGEPKPLCRHERRDTHPAAAARSGRRVLQMASQVGGRAATRGMRPPRRHFSPARGLSPAGGLGRVSLLARRRWARGARSSRNVAASLTITVYSARSRAALRASTASRVA